MDGIRRDIRFALRGFVRQPAFSLLAAATLALGIGATTAAFTLVNAVILRSLPFPQPERLVSIVGGNLTRDDLDEWNDALPGIDRIDAYTLDRAVLTGNGPAEELRLMPVSDGYFDLLGARARTGRLIAPDEYQAGAPPAAVISHRLWSARFNGDPAIAGRVLDLDGVAWTVVGVLEPGFDPLGYSDIDVFVPIARASRPGAASVGRLSPGSTVNLLREQTAALAGRLGTDSRGRPLRINVQSIADIYYSELRVPLGVAFGAAAIVLLIACANVASLLFARATERITELAVRSAIGASRIDIVRQLLIESSMLAIAGAAGGTLLAWWAVDALPGIAPVFRSRLDDVHLDPLVLAFAIGLAILTTIVAGLAPAIGASRAAARAAAATPRSTSTRAVRRLRETLIAGELALALVLLIGSSLLVRTFLSLRPASPGFSTANRITASLDLRSPQFVDPSAIPLMRSILERLRALPGAPAVAAVTNLPLSGTTMSAFAASRDGQPVPDGEGAPGRIHLRAATPGYFDVLSMRLASGRNLHDDDGPQRSPVIVVNETAARRLWPGIDNPIGHTIAFDDIAPGLEFTVIGIAADTRVFGGTTSSSAEVFVSWWQVPVRSVTFVVHDPTHSISAESLRQAVADVDPDLPISTIASFESIAGESVSFQRFQMILMSLSAALALLLALVGCYATLAYNVAQRAREFGVRVALGATPVHIVRTVLGRGLLVIAAGLTAGIAAAAASTRVIASLLHGVAATDAATFAATAAALAAAATLAAIIPARRAASVEPLSALRTE